MNVRNSVFKSEDLLMKDVWSCSSWNFSSHQGQVEKNGKNLPHVHGANKSNFKEEKEEHKQIHEGEQSCTKRTIF